jgi:hypothetical protein
LVDYFEDMVMEGHVIVLVEVGAERVGLVEFGGEEEEEVLSLIEFETIEVDTSDELHIFHESKSNLPFDDGELLVFMRDVFGEYLRMECKAAIKHEETSGEIVE